MPSAHPPLTLRNGEPSADLIKQTLAESYA
jgi:hypothetical protein